jgi:SPP1 gp7 family putative phage head morphogenesis protein
MAKKSTFSSPDSQEREYTRLLLRYAKTLKADINRLLLPRIGDISLQYNVESRADTWIDTITSIMAELAILASNALGLTVSRLPGQFAAVSKFNESQFKIVVKANTGYDIPKVMPGAPKNISLGVNVFRSEPFLAPLAEGWVSENTSLIKSLPTKLHPELEGIIRRGVMNGQSVADIKDAIKAKYDITDARAKLIAQDQTLKLNAKLTEYRLKSVGVEEYTWKTAGDSRVRPTHVALNGKKFSWGKPPPEGAPGTPVRCRCRAEAIWPDDDAD